MLFAHAGCIVSMLKSLKELHKSSKDANALTTAIQTPLKCQKCARLHCLSGYMLRYNDFLHNKMPWSIENLNKHHKWNFIQLSAGYFALFWDCMRFENKILVLFKCHICFVNHPSISKCHTLVASHLTVSNYPCPHAIWKMLWEQTCEDCIFL